MIDVVVDQDGMEDGRVSQLKVFGLPKIKQLMIKGTGT